MGDRPTKMERPKHGDSPLLQAQSLKQTRKGLEVNQTSTDKVLTRRELDKIRRNPNTSPDVRIITNPPFSRVDRITDHLYLTGVAGLTKENLLNLNIRCIINATYEMPLITFNRIESWRVPVDDDPDEEIFIYFEDVATKIHKVSKTGGKTAVHCMAGASRSSTLVIAYLIKYKEYTLKNAFCYLKSLRACARPNIGFFNQLIEYETFYRDRPSTSMMESKIQGKTIYMPDFYKSKFPDLYKTELVKQLNRAHASRIVLQTSNKNYINRKRDYKGMREEMDKMRDEESNSGSERDEK